MIVTHFDGPPSGGRAIIYRAGNSMSDPSTVPEANTPGRRTDSLPVGARGSPAVTNRSPLWNTGDLFHVSTRYPRNPNATRVDRLAGILRNGLVAPACCQDGSVCSDLHLVVIGTDVPYDSLIFLHRFGPNSSLYRPDKPGRFAVFVDPAMPVLTPADMGTRWVVLCRDEMYVRDRIPLEKMIGVAVHRADADSVMKDLLVDFQRLRIPLYDLEGDPLWQPVVQP
jgi:hypothetical protein